MVTRTALLLAAPRVVQAVFAGGLDFFTWTLAQKLYGSDSECAPIAVRENFPFTHNHHIFQIRTSIRTNNFLSILQLALTALNPWNWFCSTRTLLNCLETTLTSAALCYWPWQWTVGSGEDESAIGPRLRTDDPEFIPAQRFGSVAQ